MFGGLGNMGKLMKQAKEMQANIEKAQETVLNLEVENSAVSNLVSVKLKGDYTVKVELKDEELQDLAEDKEMLEDTLGVAFQDALSKLESEKERIMKSAVPEGMNLPL